MMLPSQSSLPLVSSTLNYLEELPKNPDLKSQDLGHLGLVAGMCRELKIAEIIDKHLPSNRIVSHGTAVCAMILNGLGFVNQRLYLTEHFFQNKPVSRLLGVDILAEHLNDDTLGRTLDALHEYGLSKLYGEIALNTVTLLKLSPSSLHLDGTSFHVDGNYNHGEEPPEGVIRITQGYSRDHRPDLNQVVLNLIMESQAKIPLHFQLAHGNSNDKTNFESIISSHLTYLKTVFPKSHFVADGALYIQENLPKLQKVTLFVSRVPATIKEVQDLIQTHTSLEGFERLNEHYSVLEVESQYGGVPQRWLLFHSQFAVKRSIQTVQRRWFKTSKLEEKKFKSLNRTLFACPKEAQRALDSFQKSLSTSSLKDPQILQEAHYHQRGRPSEKKEPTHIGYRITGILFSSLERYQQRLDQQGFFVLATNDLNRQDFPPLKVLESYKDQSGVERGFRFLKTPEFLASSFFVHRPERLMAILMIMTLCLMVYAALEYRVQNALSESQQKVPNQVGKLTSTPTTRWIFHLFHGIHLLFFPNTKPVVLNMTPLHRQIIELLGYQHYYS